ncbi:MAG: molybdenum cofactor biosynthesis protein MoaE [Nitrososphaeraceae archaeon]
MIKITESTIDLNKILLDVRDESAGAIDLFVGSVKECGSHGHVSILYYEVYKKMAENIMTQIEREILEKWNIKKILIIHRIGNLKVGEVSVAIAVSSEHRSDAFEGCRYAIENVKSRVPMWKKEITEGGEHWVEGVPLHE